MDLKEKEVPDVAQFIEETTRPYRAQINATPPLLSLLYDVDLLPEQIIFPVNATRMAAFCEVFKRLSLEAVAELFQTPEMPPICDARSFESEFQQYRRKQIAELRPVVPGESMTGVSISAEDAKAGSPKPGDMIARNPKNHADQWLVAAQYFTDNFESVSP